LLKIFLYTLYSVYTLGSILFFYSCNPEKKILQNYISANKKISVLILTPDHLFKTNDKSYRINNFDSLTSKIQDSLLFAESNFIQFVNDTEILKLYSETLMTELKNLNFQVYNSERIDSFFLTSHLAFVINLTQLQIEEYEIPFDEYAVFGEDEYSQHFDLNAINMNIWNEVYEINSENNIKIVLYDEQSIQDKLKGNFNKTLFWNEVKYVYTRKDIGIQDIYSLAEKIGRLHASYFYDYMMNKYLYDTLTKRPKAYYHYNKKKNRISQAGSARFIFM